MWGSPPLARPGTKLVPCLGEQVEGYPTYLSPGNGELLFTLLTVCSFIVFQPSMALRKKEHMVLFYGLAPDEPLAMFILQPSIDYP